MSESGRVDGNILFQDITVDRLKSDYLIGIEPMNKGKPLPKSFYERWLQTSITHIEKEAQIAIRTHTFKKEPHAYDARDYSNFCFIQLFNRPVLRVDALHAVFPTGTILLDFPKEWLRVDSNAAALQVVPTQGSLSTFLLGRGGAYLPFLFQNISYLPEFWQIDYTAGFPAGQLPEDVVDAVYKRCVIDVLAQIGDLVYGPGVTSVSSSIDGFSESKSIVNNGQLGAVFTSRIAQYRKDLYGEGQSYGGTGQTGLISRLKAHYHGVTAWSL